MSTKTAPKTTMPPCDFTPPPYTGPSKAEVIATRKQFVNPGIFTYYKEPLMIVDGHMQWLFDETGRRYLDFFGGIVTVSCGHCHPKIIAAAKAQTDRIQHTTTIYLHPTIGEYAKALAARMPEGLDCTYFVNSGSEANDLAVTMARLYTGNDDVIALQNCYHGGSPHAMGLTSHYTWKYPIPQGLGVHHAPSPDPYRSPFPGTPEQISAQAAIEMENVIRYATPGKIAAFIAEPMQGVGGVTHGTPEYYQKVYATARQYGGLCIADEVQTGFGRTGDHYWGFQNYGVTPDIVTMAKGIGNGIPLAAVTCRREIAEVMAQRIHFNTFGGNPVSMAQGLAVLEVIDEDGLQENSKVVGGRFIDGLHKLQQKHDIIGDVRGKGLMIAVELVKDRATKEPAREECAEIFEQMKNKGVLIGKGGLTGNSLRIKPPMCITAKDVDFALEVLDNCLDAL